MGPTREKQDTISLLQCFYLDEVGLQHHGLAEGEQVHRAARYANRPLHKFIMCDR